MCVLQTVVFSTTPRFYAEVNEKEYLDYLAPVGPMEPHLSYTVEI